MPRPIPYLVAHPPKQTQFRPRRDTPTGLIVVHTAESAPDTLGPDTGCDNVARFIQGRSDFGSYHWLADSDSRLQLIPYPMVAYGDGTGSNEIAIHVSLATQAARWSTLPDGWTDAAVKQVAAAAADAAKWVKKTHGITVPARRVTRAESDQRKPGFISHAERDPARRSDPGKDFPWPLFLAEFRRLMAPVIPPPPPVVEPKRWTRGKHIDPLLKPLRKAAAKVKNPAKLAKVRAALKSLRSIKPKEKE